MKTKGGSGSAYTTKPQSPVGRSLLGARTIDCGLYERNIVSLPGRFQVILDALIAISISISISRLQGRRRVFILLSSDDNINANQTKLPGPGRDDAR